MTDHPDTYPNCHTPECVYHWINRQGIDAHYCHTHGFAHNCDDCGAQHFPWSVHRRERRERERISSAWLTTLRS